MSENRAVAVVHAMNVEDGRIMNIYFQVGVISADTSLNDFPTIFDCCDPAEYVFLSDAMDHAVQLQKDLQTEYGIIEITDNGSPISNSNKYKQENAASQPGAEQPEIEIPTIFIDQDEV